MHCILISFFNSNNLGDLLLSDVLYQRFTERGLKVTRCSLEGNFHIRPAQLTEIPAWKKGISFVYRRLLKVKRQTPSFWEEYARTLQDADFVAIAGGNLLMEHSREGASGDLFENYIRIARAKQKPVYILFAGAGPFFSGTQRQRFSELLNACNFISFRDEASLAYFQNQLRIPYAIMQDPAFLLRWALHGTQRASAKARIALNVIDMRLVDKAAASACIAKYVALAKALLATSRYTLTLFSSERNDYSAVSQVFSKLRTHQDVSLCTVKNESDLRALYENTDLLIGARMHSMILAFLSSIPFIGLAWQEKVFSFFKIVRESAVYDIHGMPVSDILSACDSLLAHKPDVQARMEARLSEIRREIENKLEECIARFEEQT